MGRRRISAAALIVALVAPARAVVVGGGGNPAADCLAVFDAPANVPAAQPRNMRCADGDPCDADGAVDGSCRFAVAVCANSSFDSRCTSPGVQSITVEHALDNGDPRFDPDFQALQSRIDAGIDPPTGDLDLCTTLTNLTVAVRGPIGDGVCRRGRKVVKMTTLSLLIGGVLTRDSDRIKLTCEPAPAGCDPRAFFDGTFDRIQKQIFNHSCAVSGCHDSQSQQAGLLLETGAAHANLVNATPTNSAAAADGWARVTPGDPDTSFLYHKLLGDLPFVPYGSRMPLGQPALDQSLIDVIRLWIEAGAPETGWVPGTDQ